MPRSCPASWPLPHAARADRPIGCRRARTLASTCFSHVCFSPGLNVLPRANLSKDLTSVKAAMSCLCDASVDTNERQAILAFHRSPGIGLASCAPAKTLSPRPSRDPFGQSEGDCWRRAAQVVVEFLVTLGVGRVTPGLRPALPPRNMALGYAPILVGLPEGPPGLAVLSIRLRHTVRQRRCAIRKGVRLASDADSILMTATQPVSREHQVKP